MSGRYKARGIAHFGIDYFKANVEAVKDSPLLGMSENSNIFAIDSDTVIELLSGISDNWKRYFIVRDRKTNIHMAFVGIGGKKTGNSFYRDFYEVTGQGLILRGGPDFYIAIALKMGLKIKVFTRIDVCLDLINITVPYFYNKLMVEEQKMKSGKIHWRVGEEETIYFGEKSRKKNRYQLVRIYNKKRDNVVKHKAFLYPQYEQYESVTRLEVEIREDKAKFWNEEKLMDINFIFAVIVKQFYRFNYQFFGFLKFDDFLKIAKFESSVHKERNEKIRLRQLRMQEYGTDFENEDEENLWKSTFITYGKRLIGNGYTKENMLFFLGLDDK